MKKILCFIIIAAILATSVLSLTSCDKPDIYVLVENILQNKDDAAYFFDAELSIQIKKDYLNEAMPEKMTFKINGMVSGSQAHASVGLVQADGENIDLKTSVYKKDNLLWFKLDDLSRIILDLLSSTDFIDEPVKTLFDGMVDYDDGSYLYFDLKDFNLIFFDSYVKAIDKAFAVKSSVKYDFKKDVDIPEYELIPGLNFSDIKNKIEKELLKLPGYRYSELYIVMETDENKNNFINILATRENGKKEILEKVKIDCDLAKVRENTELAFIGDIIPMRYLLELLGETVSWDNNNKQAYITQNGRNIYFTGSLIKSKTYISLFQIMTKTDYLIDFIEADEYIEVKIFRK